MTPIQYVAREWDAMFAGFAAVLKDAAVPILAAAVLIVLAGLAAAAVARLTGEPQRSLHSRPPRTRGPGQQRATLRLMTAAYALACAGVAPASAQKALPEFERFTFERSAVPPAAWATPALVEGPAAGYASREDAGPRQQTQPDTLLALTNVTVIDGTGAPPMPNMTVLVAGDRIADIFATGAKPVPPGTAVRELPGRFVIPGLIDAHVHIGGFEPVNPDAPERVLRGGVTAVRVMGGSCESLAELARRAELGDVVSPDIYFAANTFGPSTRPDPRFASPEAVAFLEAMGPGCIQLVAGDWDPIQLVSAAKATGATGLKFYHSLTGDAVRLITEEAHRQGLQVWAHATLFPARPGELVDAGVDGLSHAAYLIWQAADSLPDYHGRVGLAPFVRVSPTDAAVDQVLRRMAERGTVLDATLLVFQLQVEAPDSVADFRANKATYVEAAQWATAVTRRARELGVTVAAGTDAMGAEQEAEQPNLHRELELLVHGAGFSPLEAITAATHNSARAIGVEDTRGTIGIGKLADLVVLRADPTADIRNTRQIELVVKRGRVIE